MLRQARLDAPGTLHHLMIRPARRMGLAPSTISHAVMG